MSAAESVAEIRRAKEIGLEVTAEVSPHHLCLTDEAVRSLDAARAKMNPPLRAAADRAALIDALADGTLDCVATDHAPHRSDEKELPFEEAANGVIGLETAFSALYTHLVAPGLVSLATVIERMSMGPARAFGLEPPALRVGAPANLAAWDLARDWLVGPPYASRSTNCAFAGQLLRGICTLTRGRRRDRPPRGRGGGGNHLMASFLVLEDGTVYRGRPYAGHGLAVGEVVFTTSMTGYQEVVTDPSFAGQLVTFTQPMIGNYGVEADASESSRPHALATIVREGRNATPGGRRGFSDWLAEQGVVGLQGVDTRAITRRLRSGGSLRGAVSSGSASVAEVLEIVRAAPAMAGQALAGQVSMTQAEELPALGARAGPHRRPRLRRQVVDRAHPARVRRAHHLLSVEHAGRGGAGGRAGRRSCWATARATRPRCRSAWRRCARCSATRRCSGSAWATSCWGWRWAWRRTSCASAIAAPTTRCWTWTPGGCW